MKKLLLSLGAITGVIAPITTLTSCDNDKKTEGIPNPQIHPEKTPTHQPISLSGDLLTYANKMESWTSNGISIATSVFSLFFDSHVSVLLGPDQATNDIIVMPYGFQQRFTKANVISSSVNSITYLIYSGHPQSGKQGIIKVELTFSSGELSTYKVIRESVSGELDAKEYTFTSTTHSNAFSEFNKQLKV